MPLTKKGKKIMKSMKEQYGSKKGEAVFYASRNKGKIKGVEKKQEGGMAGKKSGPPPVKGPASQGISAPAYKKGGIAKGCGKVMSNRRKLTKKY